MERIGMFYMVTVVDRGAIPHEILRIQRRSITVNHPGQSSPFQLMPPHGRMDGCGVDME